MKKIAYLFIVLTTFQLILVGCSAIRLPQRQPAQPESLVIPPWLDKIKEGDEAIKGNDYHTAEEAYKAAISLNPNSEEAHLKLADLYIKIDEIEAAQTQLRESLKLNPNNTVARNFLGYLHEKIGQNEAAVRELEETLKIDPNNLYALNHLGIIYRLLSRFDEAKTAINKAIQLDPECQDAHNKNAYNYLALIYEAEGDKESAVAQLRKTLELFPDDIWTHNRIGSILEGLGRYEDALSEYLETLKIEPKNALALSRLKALQNSAQINYNEAALIPTEIVSEDIEKIISEAPDQLRFPNADAVVLLNKVDHEVTENGTSKYTTHQLIKILTDRGTSLYGEISIPYNSRSQKLWINAAHTILQDGNIIELSPEAYHDVTPPDLTAYRMYSDLMYKTLSIPGLRPGAIIEYKFTVQDAFEGVVGNKIWSWGGIEFQSSEPILYTKYALKLPREVQLNWKTYNCEIKPLIISQDSSVVYIWTYKDAPPINFQLNDEEKTEIVPRLAFSTVSSWREIVDWYQNLVKGRYELDPEVESKVRQLTEGLPDENEKVKAIYDFVTSQVRYVGIELGTGAYQPYLASEVFKRRYGDCKDKAILLIGMLSLIGVKAYPALISPAPHYKVDVDLPSIGQFNHLIVALPKSDKSDSDEDYMWLDSTSETCGYSDLPARDQERLALIIDEDRENFVQTPTYSAETNSLTMSAEIQLQVDGAIEGSEKIVASGQYAIKYRNIYKSMKPTQLKYQIEKDLNSRYPGAKLEKVEIEFLDDLHLPLEVQIKFYCENYAAKIGTDLLFSLPSLGLNEYYSIAVSDESRDIIFAHPFQIKRELKLHLPKGYQLSSLPPAVSLNWNFGKLNSEYKYLNTEGQVEYKLEFIISDKVVLAKDYLRLKRMLEAINREERKAILLKSLEVGSQE